MRICSVSTEAMVHRECSFGLIRLNLSWTIWLTGCSCCIGNGGLSYCSDKNRKVVQINITVGWCHVTD
jgi:hypothetical protein